MIYPKFTVDWHHCNCYVRVNKCQHAVSHDKERAGSAHFASYLPFVIPSYLVSGCLKLLNANLSLLMKSKWYSWSGKQPEERPRSNQESLSLLMTYNKGQCPQLDIAWIQIKLTRSHPCTFWNMHFGNFVARLGHQCQRVFDRLDLGSQLLET